MSLSLRQQSRKYGAIAGVNLKHQVVYLWDALGRSLFIIVIMFIFIQLWSAVFASRETVQIGGMTLEATIWYFLIAEIMELSRSRHDRRIAQEVRDGTIAYTLLRPYSYLGYHLCNGLGELLFKMALILLLGTPIVIVYAGLPPLSAVHLLPVLLIVLLAVLLDFQIFSIIGLLAFVVEDVEPFRLIYQKLVFVLGGLLLPLDFLPGWLQPLARLLPFNLTTYAPARLFVRFNWMQFGQIVLLQLVWLLALGLLLQLQFRWATRRLQINGG